jgi:tetratricopeptide (TPR) repeat protein
MLVSDISDPGRKLIYAWKMYDELKEPIQAERYIREAIDDYQAGNNELGLAEAYWRYAFFFRSEAVGNYRNHYEKDGFLDQEATFDTRYERAIHYYKQIVPIALKHGKYDTVTNLYYQMAHTYEMFGKNEDACLYFIQSRSAYDRHREEVPGTNLRPPVGYVSYDEYIASQLGRLRCPDRE